MVKKVPGTLHFVARHDAHSFDHTWMNMTHLVHSFNIGTRPSPRKYQQLKRLHPAGEAGAGGPQGPRAGRGGGAGRGG